MLKVLVYGRLTHDNVEKSIAVVLDDYVLLSECNSGDKVVTQVSQVNLH